MIFRNTTGEEYKIPGEVDLGFVIKFTAYQEQIKKLEKETDAIKKTQEIVVDILSLDKSKNITLEFVKERFNDIRYLKAIIENTMAFVQEIASEKNSNSLESMLRLSERRTRIPANALDELQNMDYVGYNKVVQLPKKGV